MHKNFNWNILFALLKKQLIVPVIGSDLILIKQENNELIPLYQHIAKKLAEKLNIPLTTLHLFDFILQNQNTSLITSFLKPVYQEIQAEDIYWEPLHKLAEIADFEVFLNTSFDNFLETAISKKRNTEPEIVNCSISASTALTFKKDTHKTKIFNILGSITSKTGFAKNIVEVLDYISLLHTEHIQTQLLYEAIDGKSFLFIGCGFEVNLYLSLMRALTNDSVNNNEKIKFVVENYTSVIEKHQYIWQNIKNELYIENSENQNTPLTFVNELYNRWLQSKETVTNKKYKGFVFLSYHISDEIIAKELTHKLLQFGIEVVENSKVETSETTYIQQLSSLIRSATIFVPIISDISLNESSAYYYHKEWQTAISHRVFYEDLDSAESFIFPLTAENIDENDVRYQKFFKSLILKQYSEQIMEQILQLFRSKSE